MPLEEILILFARFFKKQKCTSAPHLYFIIASVEHSFSKVLDLFDQLCCSCLDYSNLKSPSLPKP